VYKNTDVPREIEEYTVLPLGGPATGPPKVNDLFDIEEANL